MANFGTRFTEISFLMNIFRQMEKSTEDVGSFAELDATLTVKPIPAYAHLSMDEC